MLYRTERHLIKRSSKLDRMCILSANLYNHVNYKLRLCYSIHGKLPDKYDIDFELRHTNQFDYRALPAHTSTQIIDLLYKNWKSYFAAKREYKLHPEKFSGLPSIPAYKKGEHNKNVVLFSPEQCRIKNGKVIFPKAVNLTPIETKVDNIVQVRIVPQVMGYMVEVIYEKEPTPTDVNEKNILYVTIGENNLATCLWDNAYFIINGRPLKSMNKYYDKRRAALRRQLGGKGTSKRINRMAIKHMCKIQDYTHKASKHIINYAVQHKIGTIVVDGTHDIIKKLSYKAEDVGIKIEFGVMPNTGVALTPVRVNII